MGFYLLGRGREDGEMRLISDVLYSDRQSALDALSQISSDPDSTHRSAEVFVADLDQAMPVLVVASAAPAAVDSAAVVETEPAEEIVTEALVVEEPIAEAVMKDARESAESADPEPEESPSLAHALKNAATSLESEGIVAPESVGPVSVPAEPEAWPWEKSGASEDAADTPGSPEPESVEITEPPEAEAQAEEPILSEPPVDEILIEEPTPAYVPDPFEEPSVDVGDLVSARGADDLDLSRTVVMGAYADEDVSIPSPPIAEFDESTAVEPIETLPTETAPEAPVFEDSAVAESVATPVPELDEDDEISGMLADLETIETPEADATENPRKEDENGVALTCDDCVYVNTCPNKNELEPGSCGNFQWKSI